MARRPLTIARARLAAGHMVAAGVMVAAGLLLVAACDGRDEPAARGGGPPPPPAGRAPFASHALVGQIVRPLRAGAAVEVRSTWQPESAQLPESGLVPVFARDFETADRGDFAPVATGPDATPPIVSKEAAARGVSGLRFARADGAALWWLPATADTTYVVRCAIRRHQWGVPRVGETPESGEERALIGRLGVVELMNPARPAALTQGTHVPLDTVLGARVAEHRAPPTRTLDQFETVRLTFRTSSTTQSLLLALNGGTSGEPGPIDFDALELFAVPLARALQVPPIARITPDATPPPSKPSAWTAFLREFTVAGETRRALIAVPPTEIRIPLALPRGPYRLRFGWAIHDESRERWGREPVRFAARIEQGERTQELALAPAALAPALQLEDGGWHDVRFDGDGDGGAATLVLSTQGARGRPSDDVALFSEPTLTRFDGAAVPAHRNVVVISVDTLRRDRVGCFGGRASDGAGLTPAIDAFAAESVVFADARTLAPYTLPSHATLLTGLHPVVHGVERYDSTLAVAAAVPSLAQRFGDAGWLTAAFTGGGFLAPVHGLQRGFERWATVDPFLPKNDAVRHWQPRAGQQAFNERIAARNDVAAIGRWLADHRDEPFFLFVHSYVVHNYRPPADLWSRFVHHPLARSFRPVMDNDERTPTAEELVELTELYDACVAAADREIGALLQQLRDSQLLDSTVVVLLSDHGEELGDHGGFGHGRTLYDEVLRVPLLVRAPGIAPRTDDARVSLADVAPTLLALAGLEPFAAASGRALLPKPAAKELEELPLLAVLDEIHLGRQRALFGGTRKWIEVERMSPIRPPLPSWSLFDLATDPAERVDLVPPLAALSPEFAALHARAGELYDRLVAERAALGIDPNAATVENPELQQIGYGDR